MMKRNFVLDSPIKEREASPKFGLASPVVGCQPPAFPSEALPKLAYAFPALANASPEEAGCLGPHAVREVTSKSALRIAAIAFFIGFILRSVLCAHPY